MCIVQVLADLEMLMALIPLIRHVHVGVEGRQHSRIGFVLYSMGQETKNVTVYSITVLLFL